MPKPVTRARPNVERKQHSWEERRLVMNDALDAAIHCMTLAYEHPDDRVRALLAQEAVMWSNFVIANSVQALTAVRLQA